MLIAERVQNDRLRQIIKELQRHRFGRRAVLRTQCLDRRIDNRELLASEIAAWERQRNKSAARINWMFTPEKARAKMARAYPTPANES